MVCEEGFPTVSDLTRAAFWKGVAVGFGVAVVTFTLIGAFL